LRAEWFRGPEGDFASLGAAEWHTDSGGRVALPEEVLESATFLELSSPDRVRTGWVTLHPTHPPEALALLAPGERYPTALASGLITSVRPFHPDAPQLLMESFQGHSERPFKPALRAEDFELRTTETGGFYLHGPPGAREALLRASARGHRSSRRRLELPHPPLILELQPEVRVQGQLTVLAEGPHVSDYRVWAAQGDRSWSVQPASDGSFELTACVGTLGLEATWPGFGYRLSSQDLALPDAPLVQDVQIDLTSDTRAVHLHLSSASGAPLADAEFDLFLQEPPEGTESILGRIRLRTDDSGGALAVLPQGAESLSVHREGRTTSVSFEQSAGDLELRLADASLEAVHEASAARN
jgi:hypothetical protein